MKESVWKFELDKLGTKAVEMPVGAEILTMQTQNGTPCIWALVNPDAERETRHFEVYGTGHPMFYDARATRKYVGTYQLSEGDLVLHVFEYTEVQN